MDEELDAASPETVKQIITLEETLTNWRRDLPEALLSQPSKIIQTNPWPVSSQDFLSARLSVITQLRYHNVRILLHRANLQTCLQKLQVSQGVAEESFLLAVYPASVAICRQSAVEIIDTIHKLSENTQLLGARWFSIYYGASLPPYPRSPANLSHDVLAFNAALVIFSCLLLNMARPSRGSRSVQPHDRVMPGAVTGLTEKLKMAAEATERLNDDTQSARRVLKILRKLISIGVMASRQESRWDGMASSTGSGMDQGRDLSGITSGDAMLFPGLGNPADGHDSSRGTN